MLEVQSDRSDVRTPLCRAKHYVTSAMESMREATTSFTGAISHAGQVFQANTISSLNFCKQYPVPTCFIRAKQRSQSVASKTSHRKESWPHALQSLVRQILKTTVPTSTIAATKQLMEHAGGSSKRNCSRDGRAMKGPSIHCSGCVISRAGERQRSPSSSANIWNGFTSPMMTPGCSTTSAIARR